MERFGYIGRLSLAAHWFLSKKEAEETVEDYREILAESGEGKARDHFGTPLKAVLAVADRREALRWHLVFLLLVLCAMIPVLFRRSYTDWFECQVFLNAAGAAVSLFYFGMGGRPKMPWALKISAGVMALAGLALTFIIIYYTYHIQDLLDLIKDRNVHVGNFLMGWVFFFVLASILGLVLARLFDGRWRVLFIFGLGILVLCCYVFSILTSMDPTIDPLVLEERLAFIRNCAIILLITFGAAGVGLC